MAPRKTRRSAAAAPAPPAEDPESGSALSEAEESPEPQSPNQRRGAQGTTRDGLNFKETLLGRPGKPIPVAQLLKRLQSLAEELKNLEQEESDEFKESCKPVAKELSDSTILNHKDKGVRAFAAQCIVDLLALCAPDAPFSTQALKNAFELIIKVIFPALADPSHAYNTQHIYVLDSLADVKSILLITDLPTANKLLTQLFTTFFDIFAGTSRTAAGDEPVSKHVEFNMLQILVTLIDEAESLPQEVVDIIVAQFLRADLKLFGQREDKKKDDKQSTLMRKELPTAYVAAKRICEMVPEKMAREISKYFSDVILEASGANADGSRRKSSGDVDDIDDSMAGPSEEDMHDLQKAHRLVRELWRACPPVLQSVVPQLEAELSVENTQLRVLATETLGDMISGIGAAGPPPPSPLDPAAYPPMSLAKAAEQNVYDPLTTPASPQSFPQTHPQTYAAFLGRRQDKSSPVRSAWTTAIGRILSTNAGGVGLNHNEEQRLVGDIGRMMNDSDEKVRMAAVRAVGAFNCHDAVNKLAITGGMDQEGSAFNSLAAHVKDKRQTVRAEAVNTLARFWAAAHGELAEDNEQVVETIGPSPRYILDAWYTNNLELQELIEKIMFETLLPMSYPPIKAKKDKSNGASRAKESQSVDGEEADPDLIRAERMLVFAKSLDDRAQRVFLAFSTRQNQFSKYVLGYLSACEDYNGGVMDTDEAQKEKRLTFLIESTSKLFEDRQRVHADLWKFARIHDRRNYQLIRFCVEPQSEYRTVKNSMRELTKRVSESANPNLMETLTPILYRSSVILYNRSHVPAILKFAKTNEKGLAGISNLLLKDISEKSPAVLETHIQEMCQGLQDDPPGPGKPNSLSVLDNLKACAAFARGYPHKLPKDRKFIQALTSYTLYGSPPEAGKHAVSIILGASDKKSAAAKEVFKKCLKGFKYGQEGFLTRLAAVSQLMNLAPEEASDYQDEVFRIVMDDILTKVRTKSSDEGYTWSSEVDEECTAKLWAIKVVVNRIRSYPDAETLKDVADPILATLSYIVANEGDLSPLKDTPADHKPKLRLLAAHSILKLCRSKRIDDLLDGLAFVKLAEVAQDSLVEVRSAFLKRLRKYMERHSLQGRFFTIPCLLAYEPDPVLKFEMTTWLKVRTKMMQQQTTTATANGKASKTRAQTTMEATAARLISVLAHHTDYDESPHGLLEMSQYLLFYLSAVATAENISLIYHLAQRVKAHRDNMLDSADTTFAQKIKPTVAGIDFDVRLHTLSDLACATVRSFVEAQSWNIQTLPGRATLPRSLFREIKNHDEAITVAEKDFLGDVVGDDLDVLVRQLLRKKPKQDNRKRKSEAVVIDDSDVSPAKRAKRASTGKASRVKGDKTPKSASKKQKTPKRARDDWGSGSEDEARESRARDAEAEKNRRKSGRKSGAMQYNEDDEDEDEMEGVAVWEYENGTLQRDGDDGEDSDEDGEEDEDDEQEDAEDEEEDEEQPEEEAPPPKSASKSKVKPRSKKSATDNDIEMADADVEVADDDEEPPSSPPATGRRGRATAKIKAAEKAAESSARSSSTVKGASAGRAGRAQAKATKTDTTKSLPTRQGRSTRSGR